MIARLAAVAAVLAAAGTLLVGASLAEGNPAASGRLDERQVAGDARWIVHVDFDALRTSPTAQAIIGPWLQVERVRQGLDKIRETIGLDLESELRSITFYGAEPRRGRGVALVSAMVDRARLQGFLATQPEHAIDSYRDHEIHRWTHRRGEKHAQAVHACLPGGALLLFAQDLDDLKAALDTLDGRRPSLAANGSPLVAKTRPGAIVEVRAAGLADAELPLKSPIIRLSEWLRIVVGEHEDAAFVEARLRARSEENASDIRDVVTGAVAMAKLYRDSDEDALKILTAVRIRCEQHTVILQWQGLAGDALKVIGKEWRKSRRRDPQS